MGRARTPGLRRGGYVRRCGGPARRVVTHGQDVGARCRGRPASWASCRKVGNNCEVSSVLRTTKASAIATSYASLPQFFAVFPATFLRAIGLLILPFFSRDRKAAPLARRLQYHLSRGAAGAQETIIMIDRTKRVASMSRTVGSEERTELLAAEAAEFRRISAGPGSELGVGPDPSPAEAGERRERWAALAAHLAGPLSRKALRAKSPRKMAALRRAVRRVSSGLELKLQQL